MARRDPLDAYRRRRDFTRTAEPSGEEAPQAAERPIFIVQKHDATRLHWDFRLEVDGVLKSWAVTRGPSIDPADKRLAVRTEDHPMAYAEFEGSIPKGEYGGGTVMLWDRGHWAPVPGKSADDIEEGHLHFRLWGERMKGEWLLVRMKPRGKEKRENWLLRKIEDAHAGTGDTLVERNLTSVLTGRSMAQIASDAGGRQSLAGKKRQAFADVMERAAAHNRSEAGHKRRKAAPSRKAVLPDFEPVQLATLVDAVPASNAWMHEIKFDGYRILAAVAGGKVRLHTRTGLDWTERFAGIAQALAALDLPPALIDGEVVAFDAAGNPSFSALQAALKEEREDGMAYFAFDLLRLSDQDLKALPNIERKERLAALLADAGPPLYVADHVIGAGGALFDAMCKAGQEGIIAERADAPYRGDRTRNWVKVKCTLRQEFVLLGWTQSPARGRPFGALLLGQWEGGTLTYKGKVGTGFDAALLEDLSRTMAPLAADTPPADVPRAEARRAHWLRPELVAEIAFAQFTADGRVRHASFIGLRQDKKASDVTPEIREKPVEPAPITITHPDRVLFPESGQTKGDLAAYYQAVTPLMLPFAAGRPLSLVRCPQGRAKQCFFQKHDSGSFGEHVHHVPITEKDGASEDYLYIEDAEGLLSCVQMGAIEFHGWAAMAQAVERPDRMIFDLDPDIGLDFAQVKKAAFDIRRQLADLGLVSFALLSGGKGVHVTVPLRPGHDWEAHRDFAQRFAKAMAMSEPDRFIATMSKAKRKGRIFIDWLRNQRGSTAVLPYSVRAREGAPVAVPLDWEELERMENAHPFGIADLSRLIERAGGKSLAGWGHADQPLPEL
ncbi:MULTISPECIES: DNA ligase D [unclassified Novosphingobium]|uniref:DNA ligase D n=1 Tax=unclassified Novosphingobium TaxID=2644732 RepID=UPI00086D3138|nr:MULTISPECIES: DNA ligase D [unclassified Novosphingobium]MBN9146576.1 DNA ligase D [Novosphingobium sp.]ODU78985.1 MAG: ATP-dependent DNA ligase [Novosphingobium sp. SCN 63-17]OJX90918.1 MAG: ATP-dependent DNA ligase [Novosphingobium sp. 63-713]